MKQNELLICFKHNVIICLDLQGRSKSLTSIDSLSPHTASSMNTGEVSPRGSVSSRGQGGRAGSVSIHGTKSSGGMERGSRSEDLLGVTGSTESHRGHLSIVSATRHLFFDIYRNINSLRQTVHREFFN